MKYQSEHIFDFFSSPVVFSFKEHLQILDMDTFLNKYIAIWNPALIRSHRKGDDLANMHQLATVVGKMWIRHNPRREVSSCGAVTWRASERGGADANRLAREILLCVLTLSKDPVSAHSGGRGCVYWCVFCVLPARRSTNKGTCWEQVFSGSHRTCPFFPNLKCLGLSCSVMECCWTCWQTHAHRLCIVGYSAEWILCSLRWCELHPASLCDSTDSAPQRHRIAVYVLQLVKC